MVSSRWYRLPLTLFLCVALLLPGCANNGGEADDPTDVCLPERSALRGTGDYFAQDILGGAALGAIGGGLIGLAAGGNARSALLGALAGGAAGAAGGYLVARQRQAANDAQLYQSVTSDIDRENLAIDKSQFAFDKLTACRNNEAARIRADYRAGRIGRDLAQAAMAGVRARADSDIRLATSISNHIRQRSTDFSDARDQIRRNTTGTGTSTRVPAHGGNPRTGRLAPAGAVRVEEATSTNVVKRDQFQNSIARAQANRTAFELS